MQLTHGRTYVFMFATLIKATMAKSIRKYTKRTKTAHGMAILKIEFNDFKEKTPGYAKKYL